MRRLWIVVFLVVLAALAFVPTSARRAQQALVGEMMLPPYYISGNAFSFGFGNIRIQATTWTRMAVCGVVPKTGTLDKWAFTASFVSSPSDVKFSFQDPDTNGDPDGTVDQYRVLAGGSIANGWLAPGLVTSDGTDGGSKRSVTVGDFLCLVAEWDSTQSGEVWMNDLQDNNNSWQTSPWGRLHNGTSWNTRTTPRYSSATLYYSDATFAALSNLGAPFTSTTATNFNTSSTPDERGLYFSLPSPMSVGGAWASVRAVADGGDFSLVLYDSDGTTVLRSATFDSDYNIGSEPTSTGIAIAHWNPVTLSASTNYRVVVKPTTTNNVATVHATFDSAGLTGVMGGGTWHLTTRTDAGSWSQTTTDRPFIGLMVSGTADDTGGSGGPRSYPIIGLPDWFPNPFK